MARYIDLDAEKLRLQTGLAADPNDTRQYAVILPLALSLRMIEVCRRDAIQPSEWMRKAISDRLDLDNFGLRMTLAEPTRRILDFIAKIYGITREGAVRVFMEQHLQDFAEHVVKRQQTTEAKYRELGS